MKTVTKILGLAVLCGTLAAAVPAAKAETIMLQDRDRWLLSDWVIFNNQGCPPGSMMVKTDRLFGSSTHRCTVPTGTKVTYFERGTTLPTTVKYTELPKFVVEALPPPPAGEIYVAADNNIYLINPQSRTVVETVRVIGPAE